MRVHELEVLGGQLAYEALVDVVGQTRAAFILAAVVDECGHLGEEAGIALAPLAHGALDIEVAKLAERLALAVTVRMGAKLQRGPEESILHERVKPTEGGHTRPMPTWVASGSASFSCRSRSRLAFFRFLLLAR